MKFLIDECLHTPLVELAHDAGHICDHVNFLGPRQRDLFRAALSHIGTRDLTNAILEVDLVGTTATCREYPYPDL